MTIVKIECERDDSAFIAVAPTVRNLLPFVWTASMAAAESTTICATRDRWSGGWGGRAPLLLPTRLRESIHEDTLVRVLAQVHLRRRVRAEQVADLLVVDLEVGAAHEELLRGRRLDVLEDVLKAARGQRSAVAIFQTQEVADAAHLFGMMPRSSGGSAFPTIVCVFPQPVCERRAVWNA